MISLLFFLIALSFLPLVLFTKQAIGNKSNDLYAVISIDGGEVDHFLLTGSNEHKLMVFYPAPGQYSIVEIDGENP